MGIVLHRIEQDRKQHDGAEGGISRMSVLLGLPVGIWIAFGALCSRQLRNTGSPKPPHHRWRQRQGQRQLRPKPRRSCTRISPADSMQHEDVHAGNREELQAYMYRRGKSDAVCQPACAAFAAPWTCRFQLFSLLQKLLTASMKASVLDCIAHSEAKHRILPAPRQWLRHG